jgi:uncharacterized protein YjbI with pentapeptide repeats
MLELYKRWETKKGIELLSNIIDCLNKGKSLSTINNLEKYNNRWDLRGAKLSLIEKENNVKIANHRFSQKTGSLKLINYIFENIDFSFSEISYTLIKNCCFINCYFENTNAKGLKVYATEFKNCIFNKTNFSYSYLNENIKSNSGIFMNCDFINTNLKECIFRFPKIENCLFENCKTYATDFNGSRFKNCKFVGLVEECWFRGYPQRVTTSILGIFNRINVKDFYNPMLNIDFTDSKLINVNFCNEIDLTNCIFPINSNYIFIKNLKKTFDNVLKDVLNNGNDEEKRVISNLINLNYLSENKINQKNDFIDKFGFSKIKNPNIDFNKFYELIRKHNNDL